MITRPTKTADTFKPAVMTQHPAAPVAKPAVVRAPATWSGRSDFVQARPPRPVSLDGGTQKPQSPADIAQAELTGGDKTGAKYYDWAKTGKTDWCGSFVSWVYQQAGIPLGPSPHGASGVNGIPHCDNLKRWFQETPGWQWQPKGNGYQPKPGDVVLFDYDGDGHMDHTGIVKSYDPSTGKLTTIEGNVGGDDKAGNGDGTLVERTYDNMKGVAGFGHYDGPMPSGGGGNPGGRRPVAD